jgi:hypothetical protein
MEPDVKREQEQPGEGEQQQQLEKVAEPAEVKQQEEEVKPEADAPVKQEDAPIEVSDDVLREKLLQMLQESDLSTVTGVEAVAPCSHMCKRTSLFTSMCIVRLQRRCFESSWRSSWA